MTEKIYYNQLVDKEKVNLLFMTLIASIGNDNELLVAKPQEIENKVTEGRLMAENARKLGTATPLTEDKIDQIKQQIANLSTTQGAETKAITTKVKDVGTSTKNIIDYDAAIKNKLKAYLETSVVMSTKY